MCIEINSNNMEIITGKSNNKKISYSVKKLLKKIFKQQQTANENSVIIMQNDENDKKAKSLESLESLENNRNADIESISASLESYENDANERLSASCDVEDYEFAELPTVPVHFVRTEHGTFFWTATTDIPVDNDLIEPLYCNMSNEIAITQYQDRWVQA